MRGLRDAERGKCLMLDHAAKLVEKLSQALLPHGVETYFRPTESTSSLSIVFKRGPVSAQMAVLDDPCDPTPFRFEPEGVDARWPEVVDLVLSRLTRPAA